MEGILLSAAALLYVAAYKLLRSAFRQRRTAKRLGIWG